MIHVGAGDDQDGTGLRGDDGGDGAAEIVEGLEAVCAESDGNELKCGNQPLQKGQLDLDGVLGGMGHGVFAEQRAGAGELSGERGIERNIAERGAPGAFGENGERGALRIVARAEDDVAARKFETGENRTRDRSGVHVAGVREDAAEGAEGRGRGGRAGRSEANAQVASEFSGIGGVEASGDGGFTNHDALGRRPGEHRLKACATANGQMGLEGLPLSLTAMVVPGVQKTSTLSPG